MRIFASNLLCNKLEIIGIKIE